ncbi:hypothetical protein XENOCAPTIV_009006, partial [Xenoophorus captivus]
PVLPFQEVRLLERRKKGWIRRFGHDCLFYLLRKGSRRSSRVLNVSLQQPDTEQTTQTMIAEQSQGVQEVLV